MIEVIDLYKSLTGKPVLSGVNLKVAKGELLTIIGGSGSGKSVFLKNVLGLMKPDSGEILINGTSIITGDPNRLSEIRGSLGMVFQNNALLSSLNLFDNLALPLRERTRMTEPAIADLITEKLALVNLTGFEKYFPAELSGGMRKRAGVARALITNPEILLYDEPTTGLDPVIGNLVNNLILDVRNKLGVTSIVVSHDISGALRISDRIAMLYRGAIVIDAPPAQVRASDNLVVSQFINGRTEGPITDAR